MLQACGAHVAAQQGVGVAVGGPLVKRAERCERGSCSAAVVNWRRWGRVRRKRSFGGRGDMVAVSVGLGWDGICAEDGVQEGGQGVSK